MMKDKQYKQHAEWLLSSQEFNLQLEAQDKFLNELADKYALKRELMHIGGRSNGSQSSLYLFYDKSPIGVITKEAREATTVQSPFEYVSRRREMMYEDRFHKFEFGCR
jgi:hypothetical protein